MQNSINSDHYKYNYCLENRKFQVDKKMSQEHLEKPVNCADRKGEAEKTPAADGGIDAAEDKQKCVVAEASGEKVLS